jgi:murein DD-endopeptidase MepM/ murein hydrolase activator NlpD
MMLVKISGSPVYTITSQFGSIDSVHVTPHTGVDIAMPIGTDILSPSNGIISKVIDTGGLGKAVFMKIGGKEKEVIFGHLSEVKVKANQYVTMGQKLGDSGNTGHSTGPHLHLAMKNSSGQYVDPTEYVDTIKTWAVDNPSFMEKVNRFADGFIHKEMEWVVKPTGKVVGDGFGYFIDVINSYSIEIIILAVDICAIGVMIGPMIGQFGGKWLGRLFTVFFLGAIWRLII